MRPCIVFIALLLGMNTSVLAQSETLHTVKRGESFALIAKRYGMTEEELKAANPDYLVCYMGLKLNIPEKYAQAAQFVPASIPASASGLSANYNQEDFVVAESSAPKRKKKGNFWKKLGVIASSVGDVAVTVASTMDEAGLLDKTGKTGEAIGGTADMVNMLRGQESNYLASATKAEDVVTEEYVDYNISGDAIVAGNNVNNAAIEEIDRQIAALQREDEMLETQKTQSLMKGTSVTRGQSSSVRNAYKRSMAQQAKSNTQSSRCITRSTRRPSWRWSRGCCGGRCAGGPRRSVSGGPSC